MVDRARTGIHDKDTTEIESENQFEPSALEVDETFMCADLLFVSACPHRKQGLRGGQPMSLRFGVRFTELFH